MVQKFIQELQNYIFQNNKKGISPTVPAVQK